MCVVALRYNKSVEETANGHHHVWFTHDDVAGYCSAIPEIGEEAKSLLEEHDGEVVATFRSITVFDKEASWWDRSECGSISSGEGTTEMFLLTSISAANSR